MSDQRNSKRHRAVALERARRTVGSDQAPPAPICPACQRLEVIAGEALCAPCRRQAEIALGMGYSRATVSQMLITGEIDVITGVAGGRGGVVVAAPIDEGVRHATRRRSTQ